MTSRYDTDSYYQQKDMGQHCAGYELEPRLALREYEAPSPRRRAPTDPREVVVGALVLAHINRYAC
jgi:hypothetical protein